MVIYLTGIVIAIVLTTLIDVIIAEGESKKFVKGVASLLIVAAIIAPLPALFNSEFNLDLNQPAINQNVQNQAFLNRVHTERFRRLELDIERLLRNQNIDNAVVRIHINLISGEVEIINVTVDVTNAVITGNNPNIDINIAIINVVRNVTNVDAGRVIIINDS